MRKVQKIRFQLKRRQKGAQAESVRIEQITENKKETNPFAAFSELIKELGGEQRKTGNAVPIKLKKKKKKFPANCAGISTGVIHITPSIHQQSTHVRMNMAFVYLAYIKRWNDISGKNPCLSGLWKHFQFHFHFTRF